MDGPITVRYDAKLMRAVVLAYWWRLVGPGYPIVLVFLGGMFAALLMQHNRSWLVGFLAGILLFSVVIPVAVLVAHYRRSMGRLAAMRPPEAQLVLSQDRFSLESKTIRSSVSWSTITRVLCYPHFWLLLVSRSQFITLPLATVPEAAKAFLLERVKAAGGRIG